MTLVAIVLMVTAGHGLLRLSWGPGRIASSGRSRPRAWPSFPELRHLREVTHYAWLAAQKMVDFWPGHGWFLALLALASMALALTVQSARRMVVFVSISWTVMSVGMWAQYVISAGQRLTGAAARRGLEGHFASSASRVLMVPAIVLTLAVPLFAGLALMGDRAGLRPSAEPELAAAASVQAH